MPGPLYPIKGAKWGDYPITTPFHGSNFAQGDHTGIDIGAPEGASIQSSSGGKVVYAGWRGGGYGYMVQVEDGQGHIFLYEHMNGQPDVKAGDTITAGTRLGIVGATGAASGPHLHFEVQQANGTPIDPEPYARGTAMPGTTLEQLKQSATDATDKRDKLQSDYQKAIEYEAKYAYVQNSGLTGAKLDAAIAGIGPKPPASASLKPLLDQAQRDVDDTRSQYTTELTRIQNQSTTPSTLGANGRQYKLDPTTGTYSPIGGIPAAVQTITGGDGKTYAVSFDDTGKPITSALDGIPGTAKVEKGADGFTYYSEDGGKSWKRAEGMPGAAPASKDNNGYAVGIDPNTGKISYRTDLLTASERQLASLKDQAESAAAKYSTDKAAMIKDLQDQTANGQLTGAQAQNKIDQFEAMWSGEARRLQQQEIRLRSGDMSKQTGHVYNEETGQDTGNLTADEANRQNQTAMAQGQLAMRAESLHALARANASSGVPGAMTTPPETIHPQGNDSIGTSILRQYGMWRDNLGGPGTPSAPVTASSTGAPLAQIGQNVPQFGAQPTPPPQTAEDLGNGTAQNFYIDPKTGQRVNMPGGPYTIPQFAGAA